MVLLRSRTINESYVQKTDCLSYTRLRKRRYTTPALQLLQGFFTGFTANLLPHSHLLTQDNEIVSPNDTNTFPLSPKPSSSSSRVFQTSPHTSDNFVQTNSDSITDSPSDNASSLNTSNNLSSNNPFSMKSAKTVSHIQAPQASKVSLTTDDVNDESRNKVIDSGAKKNTKADSHLNNSELNEKDMVVNIPYFNTSDYAQKLTKEWNLYKFFGLNTEFASGEFNDEMAMIEGDFLEFQSEFLRNDTPYLKNNLKDAFSRLENLYQHLAKCKAFRQSNVYLIQSRDKPVSYETGVCFENFLQQMQRFERVISDFKQKVRAVPNILNLLHQPDLQPYAPFIREVCSIPVCRSMAQETALNLAETAHQERKKALTLLTSIVPTDDNLDTRTQLEDKIRKQTIKTLRWQAADYSLDPGSRINPTDRRTAMYQHFSISKEATNALLTAINETGSQLWDEYLETMVESQKLNFLPEDKQSKKLTSDFLTSPLTPAIGVGPRHLKTWKQMHKTLVQQLETLSPSLATSARNLFRNNRILWTQNNSYGGFVYDGGRDVGPLVLIMHHGHPSVIPYFGKRYAEAAIKNLWDPSRVAGPSKKMFIDTLSHSARDEFWKRLAEEESLAFPEFGLLNRNLDELKVIQLTAAFDQFENEIHRLCDSLGPIKKIRQNQKDILPSVDDINKCYETVLKRIQGSKTLLELPSDNGDFLKQIKNITLTEVDFNQDTFRMNRTNFKTLLQLMTRCAVRDALLEKNNTLKPLAVREKVIHNILQASTATGFDDYIKCLGGNATDTNYWKSVLNNCYKKTVTDCKEHSEKFTDARSRSVAHFYAQLLSELNPLKEGDSSNTTSIPDLEEHSTTAGNKETKTVEESSIA